MNILCQICNSFIATATKDDLKAPIHGSMFSAPYPDRMSESLIPAVKWEFLRCPECDFRPFIADDIILTDEGIYRVPAEVESVEEVETQPVVCAKCGKPFKNERALNMHLVGKARAGIKNPHKNKG